MLYPLNANTFIVFFQRLLSHTDFKDFKDGYAFRYAVMLWVRLAAKRRNYL